MFSRRGDTQEERDRQDQEFRQVLEHYRGKDLRIKYIPRRGETLIEQTPGRPYRLEDEEWTS